MDIKNIDNYCYKMKQSVYDKAFFIDKIYSPIDFIVDYGCADGALLKFLNFVYPECKYIGYDNNKDMLEKARTNFPQADFFQNWEDIVYAPSCSLLNLSSVIHEVYSYLPDCEIEKFWSRVFNSKFKYIAIRDMAISQKSMYLTDIVDTIKLNSIFPKLVKEFENVWGSVTEHKNYIHFLLKYKYTENWNRELHENYLPLTVEQLLDKVPDNYEVIYFDHGPLPYKVAQVKDELEIDFNDATHIKLLLKLKDK